ncbi:hypothetical protein JN11_02433 [Mucilaginibacter frigoritolerans]|uniref:Uncharacterized protein n=1 Tax=Mucilaginibacter frigoritolerans TaxID=652788 RepID=A0A562U2K2_9SPHI|nr:DUF6371 domain-containing protein [Mucilaginibacter frigoritolerans]TWJ00018.1 hypothetical protein JN11_02433 [Mucilaginibacter frigoritolerans]
MHRYILEPYSTPASRYRCPECNHKRTFSRYIDTETGLHLAPHVGRCSRESKCAFHFKPGAFFKSIDHSKKFIDHSSWLIARKSPAQGSSAMNYEPSTMNSSTFTQSLSHYEKNNFTNWLVTLFGDDVTADLITRYLIGTSKHWPGATVFWQVDGAGSIRTGKIMLYSTDGKRVKKPFNHITWAHVVSRKSIDHSRKSIVDGPWSIARNIPAMDYGPSTMDRSPSTMDSSNPPSMDYGPSTMNSPPLTMNSFQLKQCLFGEHLLKEEPGKPVAIVESEKSAIIASVYLPHFVWLAAGSLSNLSAEKCAVLKGRNVTLFPDLNAFNKWQLKAKELKLNFKVSALLEDGATEAERTAGLDVADYLLQFSCDAFKADNLKTEPVNEAPQTEDIALSLNKPKAIIKLFADSFNTDEASIRYDYKPALKPIKWDAEIDELQTYFDRIALPDAPIRLKSGGLITDVKCFVNAHLENVRCNNGKPTFLPYLERLREVRGVITIYA